MVVTKGSAPAMAVPKWCKRKTKRGPWTPLNVGLTSVHIRLDSSHCPMRWGTDEETEAGPRPQSQWQAPAGAPAQAGQQLCGVKDPLRLTDLPSSHLPPHL